MMMESTRAALVKTKASETPSQATQDSRRSAHASRIMPGLRSRGSRAR